MREKSSICVLRRWSAYRSPTMKCPPRHDPVATADLRRETTVRIPPGHSLFPAWSIAIEQSEGDEHAALLVAQLTDGSGSTWSFSPSSREIVRNGDELTA
jgi:hypothetical protein